jgi:hypothetical protein
MTVCDMMFAHNSLSDWRSVLGPLGPETVQLQSPTLRRLFDYVGSGGSLCEPILQHSASCSRTSSLFGYRELTALYREQ